MRIPHIEAVEGEDGSLTQGPAIRLRHGPKASVILLGARGTGKSTLGIIAAVNLGRNLVDFETYFQQRTGSSWQALCTDDIASDKHLPVLGGFFSSHPELHVLVCPIDCLRVSGAQRLFKEVTRSHPIVLVTSDLPPGNRPDDARRSEDEDVARACSAYSYFNMSEETGSRNDLIDTEEPLNHQLDPGVPSPSTRFLHLKRLEQEFVRFLSKVMGIPSFDIRTDISLSLPPWSRSEYTYLLPIDVQDLDEAYQVHRLVDECVDAIELTLKLPNDKSTDDAPTILNRLARGLTRVRRVFFGPIICHFELPELDDNAASLSDHWVLYHDLILGGLRLCPDFLTLDLRCSDTLIRQVIGLRSATGIIGHFHDPTPGAHGWQKPERKKQIDRAILLGCQFVRLTQLGVSKSDNSELEQFISRAKSSKNHIIAYNTGPLGKTSCCFNSLFTPVRPKRPLSSAHSSCGTTDSSTLVTVPEAQSALFSSFIYDRLRLYIIGNDVSTSLTPLVYHVALDHLDILHEFTARSAASPEELLPLFHDELFGGASIAQGLKVSMLPHAHCLSQSAKIIGAINTLIPIRCEWLTAADGETSLPLTFWRDRNRAGRVRGFYGANTDWVGMYRCITKRLSPVNAISPRTTGLVIGAGGMARAAVYAMIQMGVRHIFVHNRTVSRASDLADYFNNLLLDRNGKGLPILATMTSPRRRSTFKVHVIETADQIWPGVFAQPTVVISCIRARGSQQPPQFTMPPHWLRSPHGGVVVDVSIHRGSFFRGSADD
jgi:hypothetical protein